MSRINNLKIIIFNWAYYGIVGDLQEAIPVLIDEIKKI